MKECVISVNAFHNDFTNDFIDFIEFMNEMNRIDYYNDNKNRR